MIAFYLIATSIMKYFKTYTLYWWVSSITSHEEQHY